MGSTVTIGRRTHIILCAQISYTDVVVERKRRTLSRIADASVSFISDVWKHFAFPVSRNDKKEEVTDRQKTVFRHCWTNTHLRHFLSHTVTFSCCLINVYCELISYLSFKNFDIVTSQEFCKAIVSCFMWLIIC